MPLTLEELKELVSAITAGQELTLDQTTMLHSRCSKELFLAPNVEGNTVLHLAILSDAEGHSLQNCKTILSAAKNQDCRDDCLAILNGDSNTPLDLMLSASNITIDRALGRLLWPDPQQPVKGAHEKGLMDSYNGYIGEGLERQTGLMMKMREAAQTATPPQKAEGLLSEISNVFEDPSLRWLARSAQGHTYLTLAFELGLWPLARTILDKAISGDGVRSNGPGLAQGKPPFQITRWLLSNVQQGQGAPQSPRVLLNACHEESQALSTRLQKTFFELPRAFFQSERKRGLFATGWADRWSECIKVQGSRFQANLVRMRVIVDKLRIIEGLSQHSRELDIEQSKSNEIDAFHCTLRLYSDPTAFLQKFVEVAAVVLEKEPAWLQVCRTADRNGLTWQSSSRGPTLDTLLWALSILDGREKLEGDALARLVKCKAFLDNEEQCAAAMAVARSQGSLTKPDASTAAPRPLAASGVISGSTPASTARPSKGDAAAGVTSPHSGKQGAQSGSGQTNAARTPVPPVQSPSGASQKKPGDLAGVGSSVSAQPTRLDTRSKGIDPAQETSPERGNAAIVSAMTVTSARALSPKAARPVPTPLPSGPKPKPKPKSPLPLPGAASSAAARSGVPVSPGAGLESPRILRDALLSKSDVSAHARVKELTNGSETLKRIYFQLQKEICVSGQSSNTPWGQSNLGQLTDNSFKTMSSYTAYCTQRKTLQELIAAPGENEMVAAAIEVARSVLTLYTQPEFLFGKLFAAGKRLFSEEPYWKEWMALPMPANAQKGSQGDGTRSQRAFHTWVTPNGQKGGPKLLNAIEALIYTSQFHPPYGVSRGRARELLGQDVESKKRASESALNMLDNAMLFLKELTDLGLSKEAAELSPPLVIPASAKHGGSLGDLVHTLVGFPDDFAEGDEQKFWLQYQEVIFALQESDENAGLRESVETGGKKLFRFVMEHGQYDIALLILQTAYKNNQLQEVLVDDSERTQPRLHDLVCVALRNNTTMYQQAAEKLGLSMPVLPPDMQYESSSLSKQLDKSLADERAYEIGLSRRIDDSETSGNDAAALLAKQCQAHYHAMHMLWQINNLVLEHISLVPVLQSYFNEFETALRSIRPQPASVACRHHLRKKLGAAHDDAWNARSVAIRDLDDRLFQRGLDSPPAYGLRHVVSQRKAQSEEPAVEGNAPDRALLLEKLKDSYFSHGGELTEYGTRLTPQMRANVHPEQVRTMMEPALVRAAQDGTTVLGTQVPFSLHKDDSVLDAGLLGNKGLSSSREEEGVHSRRVGRSDSWGVAAPKNSEEIYVMGDCVTVSPVDWKAKILAGVLITALAGGGGVLFYGIAEGAQWASWMQALAPTPYIVPGALIALAALIAMVGMYFQFCRSTPSDFDVGNESLDGDDAIPEPSSRWQVGLSRCCPCLPGVSRSVEDEDVPGKHMKYD